MYFGSGTSRYSWLRPKVERGGQRIDLTAKEYALLVLLMCRVGQVQSRTVSAAWDEHLTRVSEGRTRPHAELPVLEENLPSAVGRRVVYMNDLMFRFITFLIAFLLLANTAGAPAFAARSSCCSASSSVPALVAPPSCHEAPDSRRLACDDNSKGDPSEGFACGEHCSQCGGHKKSSPVGVTMAAAPRFVLSLAIQPAPPLRRPVPAGHRARLERPPSLASLI